MNIDETLKQVNHTKWKLEQIGNAVNKTRLYYTAIDDAEKLLKTKSKTDKANQKRYQLIMQIRSYGQDLSLSCSVLGVKVKPIKLLHFHYRVEESFRTKDKSLWDTAKRELFMERDEVEIELCGNYIKTFKPHLDQKEMLLSSLKARKELMDEILSVLPKTITPYIPSPNGLVILQAIASAEAPMIKKTIHHQVKDDVKSFTTVRKELTALETNGYIYRPIGVRSGYAATQKGIKYLEDKGIDG